MVVEQRGVEFFLDIKLLRTLRNKGSQSFRKYLQTGPFSNKERGHTCLQYNMMNNFSNMMMGEQFRKMDSNYSPKSSPHGGRSPVVSRQDSSGTLKATISLGKTPTIIQTGPFYSMKEPPGKGELTGDKDLMTEYGLHHTLTKFKDKKVKESLASFLPNLPAIYDGMNNLVRVCHIYLC